VDAEESSKSGLHYDPFDEQFVWVWKTPKSLADQCAVFHYPTEGPMLICSPNALLNTCPQLAVIDDVANTITITVDAIPSIEVLAGPPPPIPAMGPPSLVPLAILLMATALGGLRVRARR
jgi:hypothetical protein